MKMQGFKPPVQGDYPKLPEEFFRAIESLADQVDLLTRALQNNLSPVDNSNAEERTLEMHHGEAQTIRLQSVTGKAVEVRARRSGLFDRHDLVWEVVDDEHVRVAVYWDSEPAAAQDVVLLIEGAGDAVRSV